MNAVSGEKLDGLAPPRTLAPFRIEPQFVERVWGYRDLRPWFDRVAQGEPIGEVWLTGDDCRVATGHFAGKRLAEVFEQGGAALNGVGASDACSPLLIKLLFAREKLSVQVHPDDAMARRQGFPRGKTECWYALSAEPGAEVAVGLKPGTTLEQVREGIRAGTLEERLRLLTVERGDMIYVDAGTVHAVWPGSVLLETQQYCDLTYRMYDYGRPRQLHIEQSLEATKLRTRAGKIAAQELGDREVLLDAEYFQIVRVLVLGSRKSEGLRTGRSDSQPKLAYLFAAEGAGRIVGDGFDAIDMPARSIVAVPASAPEFVVEDCGGLELIRIAPKWPGKRA
jgi:mannose-6-phosphate isomerase